MVICTIGFTNKSLREFISRLKKAGVKKVVDVRLNNTSQLAGYAKKEDLEYILSLVDIGYDHRPELAPTEELFSNYKNKKISWEFFEEGFINLLSRRDPNRTFAFGVENGPVSLLCSEDKPEKCHRRLVAEYYFKDKPEVAIKHL